jgi:3-isopropylmalate/(R)-2-methylmalate dehydratase small subunit
LLPIVLDENIVDMLFKDVESNEGYELTVDLPRQVVVTPSGEEFSFDIDGFSKHCLLEGLDEIGLTLKEADAIRAYEKAREQDQPWLFGAIK